MDKQRDYYCGNRHVSIVRGGGPLHPRHQSIFSLGLFFLPTAFIAILFPGRRRSLESSKERFGSQRSVSSRPSLERNASSWQSVSSLMVECYGVFFIVCCDNNRLRLKLNTP